VIPYFSIKEIQLRYSPPSRRLDDVFFDSQSRRVDDPDKIESLTFYIEVSYRVSDDEGTPTYDKQDAYEVLQTNLVEEKISEYYSISTSVSSSLNPLSAQDADTALVDAEVYLFRADIKIPRGVVRRYLDSGDINDYNAECFLLGLLFGPPDIEETVNDSVYVDWIFYFSDRNHTLRLHVSDTIPSSRDNPEYLDKLKEAIK
jgi:hypothetical protein